VLSIVQPVTASLLATAALVPLLAGCDSTTGSGGPTPTSHATPKAQVVLLREAGHHARRWPIAFRIPYGTAAGELGRSRRAPGIERFVPASFIVDARGISVLDTTRGRIALFSMTGRYRGQITGLNMYSEDMAETSTGFAVIEDSTHGVIALTDASHVVKRTRDSAVLPNGAFNNATTFGLIVAGDGLAAWSFDGLHPFIRDHLRRDINGLPVPGVGTVTLRAVGDDRWIFRYGEIWAKEFRLTAPHVRLIVYFDSVWINGNDIYCWLMSGVTSGHPVRNHQYLLHVSTSGKILSFNEIAITNPWNPRQHRRLAVAADGGVWLMDDTARGVVFRRRPAS